MRFRLTANAFIKLPTVLDDGETRITKVLDTRISHPDGSPITPSQPLVMDFPSNLPLDSISRRWEPLDDEAKAAQAKLGKPTSNLTGDDITGAKPKADPLTTAGLFEALANMSEEDRAELGRLLGVKAKGGKKKPGEGDSETDGDKTE